ncbi:hypothetical protein K456DRAFT_803222 [Colletotrichum gloeosporioides 23]|nr:hypothetical protein K456DRAFT_803222 [Colletotrichum gloeosporioides 23]
MKFGTNHQEQRSLIRSLDSFVDEFREGHLEDMPHLLAEDPTTEHKIRELPYTVCAAAQSMFDALLACKTCKCKHSHDFQARLRLGTHRHPILGADPDLEVDFDTFLSAEQDWQEVHIKTIEDPRKHKVVRFSVNGDTEESRSQPVFARDQSRVKRLCKHILRAKAMEVYRLELRIVQGKVFQLESTKSTSLVDKAKDAISLDQFLRERPDSLSARAKLFLGVLISSAVFHLYDTPWLQPMWSSSNILFFHTTSSQLPLRPFVQTWLSSSGADQFVTGNTGQDDISKDDSASSDDSDDDFNPDDLMDHQCPVLINLAVILMEVYSAKPFSELAQKYGVHLAESPQAPKRLMYMSICEVFERWKEDVPENTQFPKAVESCLNSRLWETDGQKHASREIIYREVVRRLELELSQAFSKTSLEELDDEAAKIDFGSWDQIVLPTSQLSHGGNIPQRDASALNRPRTSSPRDAMLPRHYQQGSLFPWPSQPHHAANITPFTNLLGDPSKMRHGPASHFVDRFHGSAFFDDEISSENHTSEARTKYLNWRSEFSDVYDKFVTNPLDDAASPPRNIRIAILDTGIDRNHPDLRARRNNVKKKHNWVGEDKSDVHDSNGHGTFTSCLLLDYAPDAELYVAKISDSCYPSGPDIIAEAITHAVSEWKVDIICMSFGYPKRNIDGYDRLKTALKVAEANNVLLFAAASNSGGQDTVSFPACESQVIAVYATDARGNQSDFSPTAARYRISLATIGEAVESAWPVHLCDIQDSARQLPLKYKSGTSFATPIMAGIAGFLLLYTKLHMPRLSVKLQDRSRMELVLNKVAEKGPNFEPRHGYFFVHLSLTTEGLFSKSEDFIRSCIEEVLTNN